MAQEPAPLFSRILYVVGEKQDDKQLVLDLARATGAAVLLCVLIDPDAGCGERPVRFAEGATRRETRREEVERRCWLDVYALEDEFRAAGIRASVVAESGTLENIQALVSGTGCDLLVLPASELSSGRGPSAMLAESGGPLPGELLGSLPCPVLITPSS